MGFLSSLWMMGPDWGRIMFKHRGREVGKTHLDGNSVGYSVGGMTGTGNTPGIGRGTMSCPPWTMNWSMSVKKIYTLLLFLVCRP